jgi:putative lipoprotein (rSAM/lipoprotein system)
MIKLNHSFSKGINTVLVVLLGVFGFTGCELIQTNRMEYGTPTADFKVKGAVVNAVDKKPVEGIQVKIIDKYTDVDGKEYITFQSKSITDAQGNFEIYEKNAFAYGTLTARVSDIENGLFEDKDIEFDFKDAEKTKSGKGWYSGELTKTLNVELTPKEEGVNEE